ncbi:calcium-binding protein, partial [Rhizobium sp. AAP43]|uniref:calcium-binding protein n=1 Tax=Rhizobium sp. AAP43 TaxID=1523420 RepID=UPI0027D21A68
GAATAVEQIVFADNTVWTSVEMTANAWIRGTTATNAVSGTNGNDTLFGSGGPDTLIGGSGSDTFVIALDGSADLIQDFAISLGERVVFDAGSFGLDRHSSVADYLAFTSSAPDATHGYFLVSQNGVTWDSDGAGSQAATSVVRFQQTVPGLTSANFGFV